MTVGFQMCGWLRKTHPGDEKRHQKENGRPRVHPRRLIRVYRCRVSAPADGVSDGGAQRCWIVVACPQFSSFREYRSTSDGVYGRGANGANPVRHESTHLHPWTGSRTKLPGRSVRANNAHKVPRFRDPAPDIGRPENPAPRLGLDKNKAQRFDERQPVAYQDISPLDGP